MAIHNICIGIDLGTTNSAIAWGRIDNADKPIKPQIIRIPRLTTDGTIDKEDLLPSCVYFPELNHPRLDTIPIVGEYATGLTGDDVRRVVRSIKLEMGKEQNIISDGKGKNYNPVDISRLILQQLKGGAEQILFRNIDFPENVAIAHPASFEKKMIEATKDAAEEVFGRDKFKLVEEPIAVFYNFWEQHRYGEIPSRLEYNKPQLVLIFDLGGGTLDVVLCVVHIAGTERDLQIDEIAKGRYEDTAGDRFDKQVGTFLLTEYQNELTHKQLQECNNDILEIEFQLYAEQAKHELSLQSEQWEKHRYDELDSEQIKAPILQIPDGDKLFEYDLSLDKYEELVSTYLAKTEKLETSFNRDDNSQSSPKNIIDPILYVLKEGQKELRKRQKQPNSIQNRAASFRYNDEFYRGKTEPNSVLKPDIVLLNGSMTRLPIIPKRLQDFFEMSPDKFEKAGNAELAVASGAAIWMARKGIRK